MTGQEIINWLNENQGVLAVISIVVAILLAFLFKSKVTKVIEYIGGNKVSIWGLFNFTKVNDNYEILRKLREIKQSIKRKDLDDPFLKKFIYARYRKNYEELDEYSKAVLWEDLGKSLKEFEESEEKYKKIKQEITGKELKALFSEVDKVREEFDYQKVDQLLAGFEEKNSDLIADIAKTYFLRADNFALQIKYRKAEEYYEKAVVLDDQNPGYLNDYALILRILGEYDKAIKYYEKALEVYLKTTGENHPNTANTYNNLGIVYDSKSDYDKAIEYYKKALEIYLKTIGENHPDIANTYNNLGIVYRSKGEYDKAIEYYKKALEIKLKTISENHPDVAGTYNNLGVAYESKGEYDKAIEYYEKALEIELKTLGEDHPNTAMTYNNLGNVYGSNANYDKAIKYYEKALGIYDKSDLPENHPNIQQTKNGLEMAKRLKSKIKN
ncbi:MAG: tetratricopeptide repeat protein [Patescibacteria group bacterium]|nr:tetratricopeptide repeat protein [Patescibacteria group bacterium]